MVESGDLHHESRAKWPISADDYEKKNKVIVLFYYVNV